MNIPLIFGSIVGAVVLLIFGVIILRKRPKRLKSDYYVTQWKKLQGYCREKSTWAEALREADELLDLALRKRKFAGKTMGERMVAAQRTFSDNDTLWFAHNLYKKTVQDEQFRLKEADVKEALVGFRQALRDIGALPNGESRHS